MFRRLLKKVLVKCKNWVSPPDLFYFFMKDNPSYSKYEIGEYTYGNPIVLDDLISNLSIGKYCSIASGVHFFLGGNHRLDWVSAYPFNIVYDEFNYIKGHPSSKGDIIVGNDVWIGTDVFIMSGVTIGDGAIIGARSVVTKNIDPFSVVVGSPARTVKYRFEKETIKKLLEIKWWEFDSVIVHKLIPYLLSNDLESFFLHVELYKRKFH